MSSKDQEQRERREVLDNDAKVRGDTFFSRAQSDADELSGGGRFKRQTPVTVTGTEAVPLFPRLTSSSPFAGDPVPTEPALGFSVNELPVIGGSPEVVAPDMPVDDGLSRQPLVRKRI
jgi:hypothetical protein